MAAKVLIAPTWELAKDIDADVTVEAEYGANVKKGKKATYAHHTGEYKGKPAVSTIKPPPLGTGTILVSHLDLDTIITCLDLLGKGGMISDQFRKISGFIEPHRLKDLEGITEEDEDKIHAWWSHEQNSKRYNDVQDVTIDIIKAGEELSKIMKHDPESIAKGKQLKNDTGKLEKESFVTVSGDIIERKADNFVNHLYRHDNKVYKGVAALNTKYGSVTISLERPISGVSCREIVQALWGPEAGGHDGIAGSPRGKAMTEKNLKEAAIALDEAIKGKGSQEKKASINADWVGLYMNL